MPKGRAATQRERSQTGKVVLSIDEPTQAFLEPIRLMGKEVEMPSSSAYLISCTYVEVLRPSNHDDARSRVDATT